MAPNKRGGPLKAPLKDSRDNVIVPDAEVAARGRGTCEEEGSDSYDGSWAAELRVFFTGLMFLTRLPVPAGTDHHPAYLMRSTAYFPLIGVVVGLWGAAFYNAAVVLWPPNIAAAAAILATVWLTGCFHEDGLADCLDGFGGGWGRAQILRIMRDSRVGTYALVGTALLLQIKAAGLAALSDPASAMVVAHAVARWTSLPLLMGCRYLEDDEFAKGAMYNVMARSQALVTWRRLLVATLQALGAAYYVAGAHAALVAAAVALVISAASIYYAKAILGGVVGDYIGATEQVCEIAIYLALGANWQALASPAGWRPWAMWAAAALGPIVWSRQIVDFAC